MNQEVLRYFFGTIDLYLIASCFFFGCIGVLIMTLMDVMGRNENTSYSPPEFDWKYFIRDNKTRFMLNFILMMVSIRFCQDIINKPPTQYTSLIIGIMSDQIALIIKKRKQKFIDNETSKTTITESNSIEVKSENKTNSN